MAEQIIVILIIFRRLVKRLACLIGGIILSFQHRTFDRRL